MDQYSQILLDPDEASEALRLGRERKFFRLQEIEREAREAEVRRQLTEQWSVDQTRDFMLWRLKKKSWKLDFADVRGSDGQLTSNAKSVFDLLCLYFSNDPSFVVKASELGIYRPDLRKGILLAGRVGCGKTALMRLFCVNQRQVFGIKHAAEIADKWQHDGENNFSDYIEPRLLPANDADNFYQRHSGLCIDDMGTEDIKIHYGNKKNVIGNIIEQRYSLGSMGPLCHITTNLNWDAFTAFYGARVSSRLKETMNMIEYKGEDRRK